MALLFFGKDPNTNGDDCPTVFVDEATADLVIQGWRADEATGAECLKVGHIPDSEAVIRIPARMVPQIYRRPTARHRRSGPTTAPRWRHAALAGWPTLDAVRSALPFGRAAGWTAVVRARKIDFD